MLRPCINPKTGAVELKDLENDNLDDSVIVMIEKEANAQSVDTQGNISEKVDAAGNKKENQAPTKQQAAKQLEDEEKRQVQNAIAKNKTKNK